MKLVTFTRVQPVLPYTHNVPLIGFPFFVAFWLSLYQPLVGEENDRTFMLHSKKEFEKVGAPKENQEDWPCLLCGKVGLVFRTRLFA
jgi:hypothetical protein